MARGPRVRLRARVTVRAEIAVSVITAAELEVGVLRTRSPRPGRRPALPRREEPEELLVRVAVAACPVERRASVQAVPRVERGAVPDEELDGVAASHRRGEVQRRDAVDRTSR